MSDERPTHTSRGDRLYRYRSSAVRAARNACKKALNSSIYQAFEGPDYAIHPYSDDSFECQIYGESQFYFELRGPAATAAAYQQIRIPKHTTRHHGGDCPLPTGTVTLLYWADGDCELECVDDWPWDHNGDPEHDIIAYEGVKR